MQNFTPSILPADILLLNEVSKRLHISRSELLRVAANQAALGMAVPRSMARVPSKDLTEICIYARPEELGYWRTTAREQGLTFAFWVRECAVPVAIAMETLPDTDPSESESFRLTPEQIVRYKEAAISQGSTLGLGWLIEQMDAAAAYFIAHPNHGTTPYVLPPGVRLPDPEFLIDGPSGGGGED